MSGNEKNQKWFIVMAAVIVCFSFSPPQAGASTGWLQRQMFFASDGAANDQFGHAVSVSGDYAIVGAYGDDGCTGSAYIFWWNGESWVEQKKLVASGGDTEGYFGISVSICGDYAIVGADVDNGHKGAAYIFKRDGDNWSQQSKLTVDSDIWDRFGCSVSISDGGYAIVGAYGANSYTGAAYIFKRDGANWVEQTPNLTASGGVAWDRFGWSVSISGDYTIVGAYGVNTCTGSAYIFKRNVDETWSQKTELAALLGDTLDYFGWAVSISDDYAIVGAPQRHDEVIYGYGSAYIFKREVGGENWSQQQELTASVIDANDQFGNSVSISGDYAIVGAHFDDDGGIIDSGSAYIFRNVDETWSQQAKILALNGAASDFFGCSVSINGNNAIVGASNHRYALPPYYSGSAYIFIPCDSLTADLNNDSKVDFADFSILAAQWYETPGVPSGDIYPAGGDGQVNEMDLGVLVSQWPLQCP